MPCTALLSLALSASLLQTPQQDTTTYARAESLLVSGDLGGAEAILVRILGRDREDVTALVLLGRVRLATAGQSDWSWEAWDILEEAWELAPTDPQIPYWQAHVGLAVGGSNGEWAIRDGLYRIWNLDPSYRDTWEIWRHAYHGREELEQAVEILARHDGDPTADLRRAQLLIALNQYEHAERLLAGLVAAGHRDAAVWALRAQGALESGDTVNGSAYYDAALDAVATDSLSILWRQLAVIASPEEDSAHAATAPADREAFFRAFWQRREPDLGTAVNERLVEHFVRLRRARREFRLLHPQAAFHRSRERRNIVAYLSPAVFQRVQSLGVPGLLPTMSARLEADLQAAGVGTDLRQLPEPDSLTRYRRFGFDGRGLVYLRFGEPKRRYVTGGDVEAWYYEVGGEPMVGVFARATSSDGSAMFGGDMVVFPTNRREVEHSVQLLQRDTTSVEAPREVHAWVATFRGAAPGDHMVYVGVTPDSGAAAVWDGNWEPVGRVPGTSPFVFRLSAGEHRLGVDVRADGELGRLRADVSISDLWRERLTVSSLLIGALSDTGFTRDDAARALPGTRRLPAGAPLALYSEIYGLPTDSLGLAAYEVEYAFVPVGAGQAVRVAFERQARATPTVVERVVLAPGEVPRGKYLITMTVRQRVVGREERTTLADVELR
jgi:tetratricopeptide (TPR) repeat protein